MKKIGAICGKEAVDRSPNTRLLAGVGRMGQHARRAIWRAIPTKLEVFTKTFPIRDNL